MRNKFFTTAVLVLISAFLLNAQDLSGVKICINPGHGGHDSNDRYISQTGFYESDGNLGKGLYLRDILKSLGATVVMTRTTNTSADDLPLSQIVAIANANNVDYFHAVHSNGYNGSSNYTLILFQGFDNGPTYSGALVMANYLAPNIYTNNRTTAKYVRGDFDFYGTGRAYLGVFKGLNMPGTLSEGSFHDYIPESFRLRNTAYLHHEAWAIARSFLQYFSQPAFGTGIVAGIVRDREKNVSYYSISSTNDKYQPINKIKVTLTPGNKVYNGDSYNNGFFMFDSLAPGEYKLVYERENYFKDSAVVTVTANKSVFADKFLQYDTTIAPVILSHYVQTDQDSVSPATEIRFEFNRIMKTESVENAFKIMPDAKGTFTWSDGDKDVTFKPDLPLTGGTHYTAAMGTGAMSKWNVPIDSEYAVQFVTKKRDQLAILSTYPQNNSGDISPTVQIRLEFDAAISNKSLGGKINLYDDSGVRISAANVKIFESGGRGYIYFEPYKALSGDADYSLELGAGIADLEGIPTVRDTVINFHTNAGTTLPSVLLNGFEQNGNWHLTYSGAMGAAPSFSEATNRQMNGKSSGMINYNFSAGGSGEIHLMNKNSGSFSPQTNIKFGMWVFGDLSGNILRYRFGTDSVQNIVGAADTLNWTGWKFRTVNVPDISAQSSDLYYGISLVYDNTAVSEGEIYLDDAQYSSSVTDINSGEEVIRDFVLYQNYPNPFNPETVIKYNTPSAGRVSLRVYDMLGRLVAVLVDGEQPAGNHSVRFSAREMKNLSSGVYVYRLNAGTYNSVKKMILTK